MILLNLTLLIGLISSVLKTQNLYDKTFKLIRSLTGVLFSVGLLILLYQKQTEFNQFVISFLIVLNALSIEINKKLNAIIEKMVSYLLMSFIILLFIIAN